MKQQKLIIQQQLEKDGFKIIDIKHKKELIEFSYQSNKVDIKEFNNQWNQIKSDFMKGVRLPIRVVKRTTIGNLKDIFETLGILK